MPVLLAFFESKTLHCFTQVSQELSTRCKRQNSHWRSADSSLVLTEYYQVTSSE